MQQKSSDKTTAAIILLSAAIILVTAAIVFLIIHNMTNNITPLPEQPEAPEAAEPLNYDVYWNIDRTIHEGQSEEGLSSRTPEEDGYYHIRFFKDGETKELKTDNYDLVNLIDSDYLIGLTVDGEGIIDGMIPIEQMPYEKTAWAYYVDGFTEEQLLRCNSSRTMKGREALLNITDSTQIYDMTGMSGGYDSPVELTEKDRVLALSDEQGRLAYLFVYSREEFMITHEDYCPHCDEYVFWSEWTKDNLLPSEGGHYQLRKDIRLHKQQNINSEASICLDLNGKTVTAADSKRAYAITDSLASLAVMDNSAAGDGRIIARGNDGDQGMCIWVSKGEFYLYSGILDASNAVSRLSGAAVALEKNTSFSMSGGEILGGKAEISLREISYTLGSAGALYIGSSALFEMSGGSISGGLSEADGGNIFMQNNSTANIYAGTIIGGAADGNGGNIFMQQGASLNLYGGSIIEGHSGKSGGNVHMQKNSELNICGGEIACGSSGSNGGNLNIQSGARLNVYSGRIADGTARKNGGSVYLCGNLLLSADENGEKGIIDGGFAGKNGGAIAAEGKSAVIDLEGGSVINGRTASLGGNIHLNNGAVLNMHSGLISGGMGMVSSSDAPIASGNILVKDSALNLYGGTIDGDIADTSSSTLSINGAPVINCGRSGGIALNSRRAMLICDKLSGEKGSICVTARVNRIFAVGAAQGQESIFRSSEGYNITWHEDGLRMTEAAAHNKQN